MSEQRFPPDPVSLPAPPPSSPASIPQAAFIPAKPRRKLIWPMEWLNRLFVLRFLKIDVGVAPDDLARLRAIPRDVGVIVASNHPAYSDPFVIFELSRQWGRYCTWMAARELFSRMGGWMGSFIRRTGAFSVWRGGVNRDAAVFACRVLYERRFPIIIFPEGHTFYLNDVILPLKPGVAVLAIDAIAQHPDLAVWIVPIVIKYVYAEDIRDKLDLAVSQMERVVAPHAAAVPPDEFWSRLYIRLHRIADAILSYQERLHDHRPEPDADIDKRVKDLCATIIRRLEIRYMGEEGHGDFFDRARHLMAMLNDDEGPQHQKDALDARFAWALSTFYAGYLKPDSSPERFAETVMKLQRELTHRVPLSFRAWRIAHVRVGEPIDIRSLIGAGMGKELLDSVRRSAADQVLDVLNTRMRGLLLRNQHAQSPGGPVGK